MEVILCRFALFLWHFSWEFCFDYEFVKGSQLSWSRFVLSVEKCCLFIGSKSMVKFFWIESKFFKNMFLSNFIDTRNSIFFYSSDIKGGIISYVLLSPNFVRPHPHPITWPMMFTKLMNFVCKLRLIYNYCRRI